MQTNPKKVFGFFGTVWTKAIFDDKEDNLGALNSSAVYIQT